ncbi:helix-turn-helix transcriptional regulator [Micromonospora humida]|uniref:helix-turn-helix transcriptional regulator n=1 Tax=Micromonospora humida TaxID=2809018 RepID=UPI0033EEF385
MEVDGSSDGSRGRTTVRRRPGQPSDPLVGRDGELARLHRAIGGLSASAHLVEVSGDPGIGKSRLLTELAQRCRQRGLPVLTGRVPPGGSVFPFGALIDALDDRLRGLRADALAQLPAHDVDVLADIFPSFPYRTGDHPSASWEVPRFQRFRAIRSMLEVLASTGPVAVILDDLHRADGDTIDALCYLMHSPPRAAVLLAFGYRPRQTPPRLRGVAAGAGVPVLRLPLAPLSPVAVRALLDTCVSDAECGDLYRRSGGNPRYLRALLDSARSPTDDTASAGGIMITGAGPGPRAAGRSYSAAETAIAAELDELSPRSRLAAAGAAVLGEVFDLPMVGMVAELAQDVVRRTIDELTAADIVRHVPETTRFRFRHPLVHQVVYQVSQPGWRLGAHARAAVALAGAPDGEVALAPHLALVATPDDTTAPRTLRRAATAVERDAPQTAARWRQAALRLASVADGAPADQHTLLLQVATDCAAAGRPRHARDLLLTALQQPAVLPSAERAAMVVRCVRLCWSLGDPGPGRDLLADLATSTTGASKPARVNLLIDTAFLELADGSASAARACAVTALYLADAGPAGSVDRIRVQAVLAAADGLTGDIESVAAILAEVVPLLDTMNDAQVVAHADAVYWIGWSELVLERYPEALRHLERVTAGPTARAPGDAAWPTPDPLTMCDALLGRTWILSNTGRHTAAVGVAATVADVAYRSGSPHLLQRAAILRRWVALGASGPWSDPDADAVPAGAPPATTGSPTADRWCAGVGCSTGASGGPDDATGGCEDLPDAQAVVTSGGWSAVLTRLMLAELQLASGDPQGCLDLLTAAPALNALSRVDPSTRMAYQELVVRAASAAGDVGAVAELVAGDVAASVGAEVGVTAPPLTGGRGPAATGQAVRAAAWPRGLVGLALLIRARLLIAKEPAAGVEVAVAAGTELAAAGLTPAAERARALARPVARQGGRHGGASGFRPGNDLASSARLTRREQQVAELVREGMTNREIAAVLVVTEKTVEMHLSHVFAKLGVRNRVRLARRLDPTTPGAPSSAALPDTAYGATGE